MPSSCFIIGAGDFFGFPLLPTEHDLIIAADGGFRYCEQNGITPDILLGDFDSLDSVPEHDTIVRFPVEKDDTDTMLAVRTGLEKGCRTFHIFGGTGGRLDHTLANLQTLAWLSQRGCRGFLYDRSYTFTVIENDTLRLPAQSSGIFSVFCHGRDAEGVTISGGQYPAEGVRLSSFFPLGVSNHFVGSPVEIQVKDGCLLIGWERP